MRRLNFISRVLFLALAFSVVSHLRAGDFVEAAASAPTPLTREALLATLSRDLAAHFNLEGDLQVELIREWTPPSRVAASWQVTVLEYPTVASASMLVRCRISAGSALVGEN